ncbi:MAG: sigma 54-interacting transcriptional regulator [Acidobacteriota bacterium]
MRGASRRARPQASVDLRQFGWNRALVATLRHPTLPWHDGFAPSITLDAAPLADCHDLGARDRLSLVAQFAAHEALLQFAGIGDSECDPAEWVVARKRGSDCRLMRVAALAPTSEGPPALTIVQQFAEAIGAADVDTLRHSWGRAEMIYQEIDARLRTGAAADLRWMRRAAHGEIAAPGVEALRDLLVSPNGRWRTADPSAVRAAAALGGERVIEIGSDPSPLQRCSAVASLSSIIGSLEKRSESEIVERVLDAASRERLLFIVRSRERFDAASRNIVEMLAASDVGIWIADDAGVELPPARFFVVSPALAARRDLEARITAAADPRAWIASFVEAPAFVRYLSEGVIVDPDQVVPLKHVVEPLRSYLAAIALLGLRVPARVASAFLERLGFAVTDLEVADVTVIEDGAIVFASAAMREAALQGMPSASRAPLARVAAEVLEANGDLRAAATLLIDTGDARAAAAVLERVRWTSGDETIRALRELPPPALTPRLAETLASALIDAGRYRDAREIASLLDGDDRELLLARAERRTGDYTTALARLERLEARGVESELLRAELLYLLDRGDEMRAPLETCGDDIRARYLGALHREVEDALPAEHYFASRLAFYAAIARSDLDAAARSAALSLARATTVVERIDAALDRVFVLFTAGAWSEARDEALRTLGLVEETQGDRAAGGILFILAFLAADDGQWAHASQRIHRLKSFYRETGDERRLAEIDLLSAHLDFCRARFAEAARAASAVLQLPVNRQMREAAALILDEIDWIDGHESPLRSTGKSGNVELTRRHELLRARRESRPVDLAGVTKTLLFRDALGRGDHGLAARFAAELRIDMPSATEKPAAIELRMLCDAAVREFPFGSSDFGPIGWRFATRNRLEQWSEIGSLSPLPGADLDRILTSLDDDWMACSDRELLFVDGIDGWPAESREALAALFRTRAENHRLRRVIEQEASTRQSASETVEGIVGQSPLMREVFALVARVARRDVPVCVRGESGTGKELVARAIHRQSARRHKPFTAVNCAALPETLIESELFGHVRGAFTGADRDRPGLIETADGGTLFLDEIGEMPLAAQAKLLRFLQEGEFRRVGDTANRTADVRVVSATNRKLEAAVEEGRFREDLYYRIGGIEIALPPLRDRASDVPVLAAHFLAIERDKHRGGPSMLSAEAESVFLSYRWPGNVRELQNTIRGAHALAGDEKLIDIEHLPERIRGAVVVRAAAGSYQDAVTRFRRDLIEKSLIQANGNQNRAAAMLKISRQALAYQIRELGILVRKE